MLIRGPNDGAIKKRDHHKVRVFLKFIAYTSVMQQRAGSLKILDFFIEFEKSKKNRNSRYVYNVSR
jgi:hypothetical protein